MSLEDRLRLLKGQATPSAALSGPGTSDLNARVRRLAVVARHQEAKPAQDESALAAALGGERIAPGVLRVEQRFDPDQRCGRVRLGGGLLDLPALWDGTEVDPEKCLFLDTETSGLAGGTGTWAFLFGAARPQDGALVVRQYLLCRLDAEAAYLAAVGRELEQSGLVVTYNGKTFDAPLLTTRFRLAGAASPFDGQGHLDLLGFVRRAFGRVWPDCRLATTEDRLLGLRRSGDLPGSEAPQAWLSWLRQGDSSRLCAVLEHNRQDLLSLVALASPLARSLRDPAGAGAEIGAVARYHLARGNEGLAFALLAANRERLEGAALLHLARLHRARGEWNEARRIWEALAGQGEAAAIDALAKYLEHRVRDYACALRLARQLPVGWERERRCRRLEARLSGA